MTTVSGRDSFLNFLRLNRELWSLEDRANSGQRSDRYVLVDLLSYDLQIYNIRTLYISKILQKLYGYRLIGLIGDLQFSRELAFDYQKDDVIRLARSFGVDEFIDLEEMTAPPSGPGQISPETTAATIDAIRNCPDQDLPRRVLAMRTDEGCRIGEYIFETVIRVARNPFLTDARDTLERITAEAHKIHNIIRSLRDRIEIFVSGHLSYTQWGITADLILRGGAKALWFDSTGNFSAYLLKQPPGEGETLDSQIRKIDRDLFVRQFERRHALDPEFVTKVGLLFSSDYFLRPYWFEPAKSPPPALAPVLRKIALRKLGWQSDPRPVVCVFFHCLSDLPRDDEQIYLDYYDWIMETLKIAIRDTTKNWIFKTHPSNRGGYDVTNATERLKQEYSQYKHIFFLDEELQRMEVFSVCDLAVTVRGSITYEIAVFGKPALLAGRSALSDLGFCFVARNAQEYEHYLTDRFDTLRVSEDMQERVNFYLIYDRVICRLESTFMPYWEYRLTGGNDFWNGMTDRIIYALSDLDPAVSAIKALFDGPEQRTINPRYPDLIARAPQASTAATLRAAAQSAQNDTAVVAIGDMRTYGLEGDGRVSLLSKPSSVDRNGSWFLGEQAASLGFTIKDDQQSASSEPLAVGLHLFTANTAGSVHINLNGDAHGSSAARGSGARVHVVKLDPSVARPGDVIVIEVAVKDPTGKPLPFRLDSLELAPETQLRAWPDFQRFAGFRIEKDGGREFAWMPHDVELCLPADAVGRTLHVAGYIPFSLHQARRNISSFELKLVLNGDILETITAVENDTFERTVRLNSAADAPAIAVRFCASSVLPEDDERRELSFVVTELSLQ